MFRFKRGRASKQMRGAKNPNALTDSNPCPKGPTRRNKRCGKKQKQTSAPWPISRSFLPLPCKLSPSCMWARQRQQWRLSLGFGLCFSFPLSARPRRPDLFKIRDDTLVGFLRQELVYHLLHNQAFFVRLKLPDASSLAKFRS